MGTFDSDFSFLGSQIWTFLMFLPMKSVNRSPRTEIRSSHPSFPTLHPYDLRATGLSSLSSPTWKWSDASTHNRGAVRGLTQSLQVALRPGAGLGEGDMPESALLTVLATHSAASGSSPLTCSLSLKQWLTSKQLPAFKNHRISEKQNKTTLFGFPG